MLWQLQKLHDCYTYGNSVPFPFPQIIYVWSVKQEWLSLNGCLLFIQSDINTQYFQRTTTKDYIPTVSYCSSFRFINLCLHYVYGQPSYEFYQVFAESDFLTGPGVTPQNQIKN